MDGGSGAGRASGTPAVPAAGDSVGQPRVGMQGPKPAGCWGWAGRGAAGPGTAQGWRGWHMGTGPAGPSLPPAAQYQGSVPVGHQYSSTGPPGRPGPSDTGGSESAQLLQQLKTLQPPKTSMVPDPTATPDSSALCEPPVSRFLRGQGPRSPVSPTSIPGPHSTTGLPSAHPDRGKPQELVPEGDFTGTRQTPCPPQVTGVLGAKGKATGLRAKPRGWLHHCRQRAQCPGSPCQALPARAG